MFDIGGTEFLVILLVALIFLGPQHLPEMARKLARVMREVRRAGDEVRSHIDPDGELYRAINMPYIPPLPLEPPAGVAEIQHQEQTETDKKPEETQEDEPGKQPKP